MSYNHSLNLCRKRKKQSNLQIRLLMCIESSESIANGTYQGSANSLLMIMANVKAVMCQMNYLQRVESFNRSSDFWLELGTIHYVHRER